MKKIVYLSLILILLFVGNEYRMLIHFSERPTLQKDFQESMDKHATVQAQANYWPEISRMFFAKKPALQQQMVSSFERDNPYVLYTTQVYLNNLLKSASAAKKIMILDGIAECLLVPSRYLQVDESGYKKWVNEHWRENHLISGQFIYLIANSINLFLDIPVSERTVSIAKVLEIYPSIVLHDHLQRWVFGDPGVFEVRGWSCMPGDSNNHSVFLNNKLNKKYYSRRNISYCNAVTDADLWIVASVAEYLAANAKAPKLVPLSKADKSDFLNYIDLSTRLLNSRLSPSRVLDFSNHSVEGVNFDLGAWDTYPARKEYSGYTGVNFPTTSDKRTKRNIGWDVSHARRWVHVFGSLHNARNITGQSFPDATIMRKLTNQLIYGTFNRDFEKPLFSNYMDGSNGWYRVDYSGKKGFAYGPYDLSMSLITGGYGFWIDYNPDVTVVMNALYNMITSTKPEIVQHRKRYYESDHYSNYQRVPITMSWDSWEMINFLSAYTYERKRN